MGRYNLLDEPWISVIIDKKGNSKNVSMIDFFKHAHEYLDMGGDTKTQDFAVMRVMIAVIHTVFSRVDVSGEPYEYFFNNALFSNSQHGVCLFIKLF